MTKNKGREGEGGRERERERERENYTANRELNRNFENLEFKARNL